MNDPDFPVAGPHVVLPAHGALVEPIDFNLQEQIDTALENRIELAQQLARIDNARITERVAKNNELPSLNLQAQVDILGVGNDFTGDSSATASQNDMDFVNSSIGLEFEIPIGNRAALAISRRVKLQRMQASAQYENLISQVSVDVTTAWREINTSWNEIVDRRRARLAAEDALRAIGERRQAGEPLTPTFVQLELDTQQQLTNAQAEEAGAISNYNVAISRLERAKGTLLRFNNVVMEEASRVKK
jgi:outer membrane protein TolC